MSAGGKQVSIGWIGVGKMGAPMVRGLMAANHCVRVFDVDRDAVAAAASAGAETAESAADLAGKCSIVVSILPNDAALDLVAREVTGAMAPGGVFVDMSTVSPEASARAAEAAARAGLPYLRAPVSGSTAMAEAGKLTVLASGDAAAWEAFEPLLKGFSSRHFYLGPGDLARYMKLVLNTMVGATAAIAGEALRLGEAGGLDLSDMMSIINESAVASPLLAYKTQAIVEGDFTPAFSVDQMIKDMTLIAEAAQSTGCDMPTVEGILHQYRSASRAGFGARDFFSLIEWQRGRAQ